MGAGFSRNTVPPDAPDPLEPPNPPEPPQEPPEPASATNCPLCNWEMDTFGGIGRLRQRTGDNIHHHDHDHSSPPRSSRGPALRRPYNNDNNDDDIKDEGQPAPKRSRSSRRSTLEPYNCPICFEEAAYREPMTTYCGHVYCKKCIVQAIDTSHKCPLCNKALTEFSIFQIFMHL